VARVFPTVIDLVGSTPIVRLDRVSRDVPGEILAKLEFMNPGRRARREAEARRNDRRADLR
jgi:cysteine synthase